MGVICPCGVIVQNPQDPNDEAVSTSNNVQFEGQGGTITGDLFYRANICVTRLETSTLTLRFEDTETPDENNFTFTANAFTSVVCTQQGQNCSIEVTGTGTINGGMENFSFEAVFRDMVGQAQVDDVQSFEITGFFNQTGAAPIDQGSIIAQGCQEV
ncbi:hypothetical protein RRV45_02045 [Bacillus sp. DTU_2020_1000418_1_SI_GHA_SEK_038]|uniref:hypothetical protein n=1 Tax=Bacillus sp. DTU_2020_1000418_1_SI_GHA_SEK_038 TaxID=3077585 RepID=UPI0028EB42FB|nr:hypothetical protein [Bacillus sp. DTU_2020_1000418_1_SI_GHA_SEK_038]WNS75837.1 hypothetical protein RRV45_02045 [Bacillus sp. DTU_2020_1000418_1_SI_GHA_SEK_038]